MNRYNVNACENDSFRKTSFEMKKNSLVYFARGIAISLVRCLLNPVVFLRRKKRKESETLFVQCVERKRRGRRKES